MTVLSKEPPQRVPPPVAERIARGEVVIAHLVGVYKGVVLYPAESVPFLRLVNCMLTTPEYKWPVDHLHVPMAAGSEIHRKMAYVHGPTTVKFLGRVMPYVRTNGTTSFGFVEPISDIEVFQNPSRAVVEQFVTSSQSVTFADSVKLFILRENLWPLIKWPKARASVVKDIMMPMLAHLPNLVFQEGDSVVGVYNETVRNLPFWRSIGSLTSQRGNQSLNIQVVLTQTEEPIVQWRVTGMAPSEYATVMRIVLPAMTGLSKELNTRLSVHTSTRITTTASASASG